MSEVSGQLQSLLDLKPLNEPGIAALHKYIRWLDENLVGFDAGPAHGNPKHPDWKVLRDTEYMLGLQRGTSDGDYGFMRSAIKRFINRSRI